MFQNNYPSTQNQPIAQGESRRLAGKAWRPAAPIGGARDRICELSSKQMNQPWKTFFLLVALLSNSCSYHYSTNKITTKVGGNFKTSANGEFEVQSASSSGIFVKHIESQRQFKIPFDQANEQFSFGIGNNERIHDLTIGNSGTISFEISTLAILRGFHSP